MGCTSSSHAHDATPPGRSDAATHKNVATPTKGGAASAQRDNARNNVSDQGNMDKRTDDFSAWEQQELARRHEEEGTWGRGWLEEEGTWAVERSWLGSSLWDEPRFGASALKKSLLSITLIDAGWLYDLACSGGIVPRWQEVPPEAKVTLAQLEEYELTALNFPQLPVLVLSYPWLSQVHPDPCGEQLRAFAPMFKAFHVHISGRRGGRCGVFWDYMSLPQVSCEARLANADDRTALEKQIFKRGLRNINLWYGHSDTHVAMASCAIPERLEHTNTTPYGARGWCITERAMSSLTKSSKGIIDLSRVSPNADSFNAFLRSGIGRSGHKRACPKAPDKFAQDLRQAVGKGNVSFTSPTDVDTVIEIYEKAVTTQFTFPEPAELWWDGLGWGDDELDEVADVFIWASERGGCQHLSKIHLNKLDGLKGEPEETFITDVGCASLARALRAGACPNFREVQMFDNKVTQKGVGELKQARPGLKVAW